MSLFNVGLLKKTVILMAAEYSEDIQATVNHSESCDIFNEMSLKLIGSGSSGSVYEYGDFVVKYSNQRMTQLDANALIIFEAIIAGTMKPKSMHIINRSVLEYFIYRTILRHVSDTRHIAQMKEFHLCDYDLNERPFLVLEKLDAVYPKLAEKLGRPMDSKLSKEEEMVSLFQMFYALYVLQPLKLNHRDMNEKNFMYKLVPEAIDEYVVNGVTFRVPNHGFHFKMIDFGVSRIEMPEGTVIFETEELLREFALGYQGDTVEYGPSVDVCSILCLDKNPHVADIQPTIDICGPPNWTDEDRDDALFDRGGAYDDEGICNFFRGSSEFVTLPYSDRFSPGETIIEYSKNDGPFAAFIVPEQSGSGRTIVNPITNRKIKVGGTIWKKLRRDGVI